jgi:ech hydrogenase subunit F
MKNFISSPATRMYPLKAREPFERSRGRIFCEQDNCIYCSLCQKKCPADAITVDRANSTWELNAFRCIICGECVNACPKKCIKMTNRRRHSSETKKIVKLKKTPL